MIQIQIQIQIEIQIQSISMAGPRSYRVRHLVVIFCAEFLGTAYLLIFGCMGCNASPLTPTQMALAWGFTVTSVITVMRNSLFIGTFECVPTFTVGNYYQQQACSCSELLTLLAHDPRATNFSQFTERIFQMSRKNNTTYVNA